MSEPNGIIRRLLTYPDDEGGRLAEGGRRLKGDPRRNLSGRPLVSVITVCWNSARTIEQTIQSVLGQTYDNIEYVIVDGASSDATLDIIRRYAAEIDYFVSEPDQGLYFAMNKGLELAQGEYILFLNSDDWYTPDAVEALVSAKDYSGCDFVSALAQLIDENGAPTKVLRSMPFDNSQCLRMSVRHETMLVSKELYNRLGPYNTDYRIIADLDFASRVFKLGVSHYEIPRPVLNFRTTGVSSTDNASLLLETERFLAAEFPFLDESEQRQLANSWAAGPQAVIDIANAHLDYPEFVKACRALLADRKRCAGPEWREADLCALAAIDRRAYPDVSIIIPVFAAENTLSATLDSVLNQTVETIEVICINDCAIDNSQSIIDDQVARDARVRCIRNAENRGAGASRNAGIRAARGHYLFFLDADDTMPCDALQSLLKWARDHDADLVRGAYLREQRHHGSQDYKPAIKYPTQDEVPKINASPRDVPELFRTPEGHCATLYRADYARRFAYPEDLTVGEDALFLCAVMAATRITVIPDVVSNYLANPISAMNVYNPKKYADVLEWRRRAFHILSDYGLRDFGMTLLRRYAFVAWHDLFFVHFKNGGEPREIKALGQALRAAYSQAHILSISEEASPQKRKFLQLLLDGRDTEAAAAARGDYARQVEQRRNVDADVRPKISIVLPFFNARDTICNCLDSIISQSFTEFEILCVNDQSSDDTQATIDDYAVKDLRIVRIRNEKNIGHGASRNRGIAAARGEYIFHVDPDDAVPPGALAALYKHARLYGSEMTRGAYIHEQLLLGQSQAKPVRKGLKEGEPHIVNTRLSESPDFLASTEGHWSYLYKADFAKSVKYPEDLKMGQDSIFIVNAIVRAKSISIIDDVVYLYRANPSSAMNTFNFRKFMDAIEWRQRAWGVLDGAGFPKIGEYLLFSYWSEKIFDQLEKKLTSAEKAQFFKKLHATLRTAGYPGLRGAENPKIGRIFDRVLEQAATNVATLSPPPPAIVSDSSHPSLQVATFVAWDYGGAGKGSQRRVEALRKHGVNAEIHCLFKKTDKAYVRRAPVLSALGVADRDYVQLNKVWRARAVVTRDDAPNLRARELFSKTGVVVDFDQMGVTFNEADIVHLHWVVGMFDFDKAPLYLGDKPVVWTLADMNAFTGGCHYSESCEGYKLECRACPLLGGSDLAHENWKKKKRAYDGMRNLHIICPSQWLADSAAESSLFRGKPIHVIPNAMPVDRFHPKNKMAARRALGLPLDKKLVVFGAGNLKNVRKGGDLLAGSIRRLKDTGRTADVEGLFFGANELEIGIPTHEMGHVDDERKLSLVYAAADVFAFPSREDNAPLTVPESLLSGTPVVGFPVGNVTDLVEHKETGYIARYEDVNDFAEGLAWMLSAPRTEEALLRSINCHMAARAHNDPDRAAQTHIALYESIRAR